MNGVIFDIKRFAVHDGPGIRTTVFLKGCPLRCRWCHNPESWHPDPEVAIKKVLLDGKEFVEKETIGRLVTVTEVMAEVKKEQLIMEESGGGVTFSGGEPLMQPQFLSELLQESQRLGFRTAVDTSGYGLQSDLEWILSCTDLFLYDLKMMDVDLHQQLTGVSNQLVINNFRWLMEQNVPVIVRIPVVAGVTGTVENMENVLAFLSPYSRRIEQVDLLPYHRTGMNKYTKLGIPCEMPGNEAKPRKQEVEEIRNKLEISGFKIKIGG